MPWTGKLLIGTERVLILPSAATAGLYISLGPSSQHPKYRTHFQPYRQALASADGDTVPFDFAHPEALERANAKRHGSFPQMHTLKFHFETV